MNITENQYQETDLGNIAPNPKGEYSDSEIYEYLDFVYYQGGSYLCLAELDNPITGISPEINKTTEYWQIVALPGGLTPEFVSAHNNVMNLAEQVEKSATEVRTAHQNVSSMKENVTQMQEQVRQYKESAESSINTVGETKKKEIEDTGTEKKNEVVEVITKKGAETLNSIPEDYATLQGDVDELKEITSNLSGESVELARLFAVCADEHDITVPVELTGYISSTSGKVYPNATSKHTALVPVRVGQTIEYDTNISSVGCAVAYYNAEKEYLTNLSIIGGETVGRMSGTVTVPDGVSYATVSSYAYDDAYMRVYNPNSDVNKLKGEILGLKTKHYNTFSILGDSYGTFLGFVTPDTNKCWYPAENENTSGSDNDVTKVEEMWWHIFANEYGSALQINNSYSGSPVCYDGWGDGANDSAQTGFIARANNIGTPELILVMGGTNDDWVDATIGDYKYSDWTEDDFTSFRPALAYLLNFLKQHNAGARIIFMLNEGLDATIDESVLSICNYYGVDVLELANLTLSKGHPTIAGQAAIAQQLLRYLTTPAPQITSFTANLPSPQTQGTAVRLTANATGGTGTLQYRFYRVKDGVETVFRDYATTNYAGCNPYSAGTYAIYVDVKDEAGNVVTANIPYEWT